MQKIRKFYVAVSPLPLVLFAGLWMYVRQFEGWGAWAAGIILFYPIVLSMVMGAAGIGLVVQARRCGESVRSLVIATLVSGGVGFWFLGGSLLQELQKSFF